MTDNLKIRNKVDLKGEEKREYFSKHYYESDNEDLNVRFKTELNEEKIITYQSYSMNTMEVKKNQIESFETYDEINGEIDRLLSKLKDLYKKKKEQGYDVSYDFDLIKYQVKVLQNQKDKIEKKEHDRDRKNLAKSKSLKINNESEKNKSTDLCVLMNRKEDKSFIVDNCSFYKGIFFKFIKILPLLVTLYTVKNMCKI
ncbi:unnamed protein product [Brachionus calyciflorus]|uniref:Uncharacterized protein n=1 Tax=Brachionus calyciflorus TaxID=104777 RepID=A0A814QW45_9BILA|nr:unnamed protein product [Brachionus calyciflorus]